jgi:hypothetical protein
MFNLLRFNSSRALKIVRQLEAVKCHRGAEPVECRINGPAPQDNLSR